MNLYIPKWLLVTIAVSWVIAAVADFPKFLIGLMLIRLELGL